MREQVPGLFPGSGIGLERINHAQHGGQTIIAVAGTEVGQRLGVRRGRQGRVAAGLLGQLIQAVQEVARLDD